jgi:predicted  nucleic acid-binding Zn-ribbon protein
VRCTPSFEPHTLSAPGERPHELLDEYFRRERWGRGALFQQCAALRPVEPSSGRLRFLPISRSASRSQAQKPASSKPETSSPPPPAAASPPVKNDVAVTEPPKAQIVFATSAPGVFQLNPATHAYETASGSSAAGCVIVGAGVKYNLLVYDRGQRPIFTVPIDASGPELTLANTGSGLYIHVCPQDQSRVVPPLKFSLAGMQPAPAVALLRAVLTVRAHCVLHDPALGAEALHEHPLTVEIAEGDVSKPQLAADDVAGVVWSAWSLTSAAGENPCSAFWKAGSPPGTEASPPLASSASVTRVKIRPASGVSSESLSTPHALGRGLVGVRQSGGRILVLPTVSALAALEHKVASEVAGGWSIVQVSVQRAKYSTKAAAATSASPSSLQVIQEAEEVSSPVEKRERASSLRERMASLSGVGPMLTASPIASPDAKPPAERETSLAMVVVPEEPPPPAVVGARTGTSVGVADVPVQSDMSFWRGLSDDASAARRAVERVERELIAIRVTMDRPLSSTLRGSYTVDGLSTLEVTERGAVLADALQSFLADATTTLSTHLEQQDDGSSARLRTKVAELRKRLEAAESEADQALDDKAAAQREVAAANRETRRLTDMVESLSASLRETERKLSASASSMHSVSEEATRVRKLQAANDDLRAELDDLRASTERTGDRSREKALEAQCNDMQSMVRVLQEENESLRRTQEEMDRRHDSKERALMERLDCLMEESASLQAKLAAAERDANADAGDASEEVASLKEELARAKEMLGAGEAKLRHSVSMAMELREELEHQRASMVAQMRDIKNSFRAEAKSAVEAAEARGYERGLQDGKNARDE